MVAPLRLPPPLSSLRRLLSRFTCSPYSTIVTSRSFASSGPAGESIAYRRSILGRPVTVPRTDARNNSCSFIGTVVYPVKRFERTDLPNGTYTVLEVKRPSGESESSSFRISIVMRGNLAEISLQYLKPHDFIYVHGILSSYYQDDENGTSQVYYKVYVGVLRGHQGDVLDLSWSKDKHLLSSSVDKTARLWRLGCDSCLGVFQHSNYVTCLQFNPANESYFISGSIDGKVRLWEILKSRVVDWIDIREIVTAVCYRPDGKTGVVGTISGVCRFFDALDNHLQLEAQVSLQDRKKSPFKRITGFEFSPADQRKLMVTSADSQVRILDGVDVISKYKGLRNSGSQISASFTSDGKHIISASEDSNVYVWNYNNQDAAISNHVKSTSACERFSASNASVAITWNGFESEDPVELQEDTEFGFHHRADSLGNNNMYLSPTGSFTLSQELFSEFLPKGTATWPEEKLPSATASALGRSQYKFLKASCQNPSSTWGQVIVTAGWDGRIRSFRNYGLPVHQ